MHNDMDMNANRTRTKQADEPAVAIDTLLTPAQAAAVLNVPVSTLVRWRSERRELPYVKVGRVVRYRRADLDAWIADHVVMPAG